MALLTLDFGFDWDSNGKSGYDGFVLAGGSGFDLTLAGSPASPVIRGIDKGDQLQFQIWDISAQQVARSLGGLQIAFQSAHSATLTGFPFDPAVMGPPVDGWYPIANLGVGSAAPGGTSGVYGGPFTSWPVRPGPLALPNDGWYFFRASFQVTTGKQTKSFGNDPEMIVRPSG